jgi:hypothetical protein
MLDEGWEEEAINAINFYGFKVLQLKQDKDTAWQKAYIAVAKALVEFVASNKDVIQEWSGQATATDFFASQLGKSEQQFRGGNTSSAPQAAPAVGNLLSEI